MSDGNGVLMPWHQLRVSRHIFQIHHVPQRCNMSYLIWCRNIDKSILGYLWKCVFADLTQFLKCVIAVASLSWAPIAHDIARRHSLPDAIKANVTKTILAERFCCYVIDVAVRVNMFLVFVRYYKYAVILKVIVHWIIMFLWIRRQGMQFYKSRCQQLFFNVAMTTTYLFCYVDLTNDYDKNNYCFYMVVRMVECLVTLIWASMVDISFYYVVTLIMWVFTNWILHMLVHYAVHGKHIGCIRCLVSIIGLFSVCFTVVLLMCGVYVEDWGTLQPNIHNISKETQDK